jgi:putative sugar O-methyltransferase
VKLKPLLGTGASYFEVGGGFGGLCQRIFPHLQASRYILTDLPVNMTLSYYNLASHFGDKVGRFWNADDVSQLDRSILIVAPWLLDQLGFSLDVAINTASFQHMSRINLEYYGAAFDQLRIGKVFHANRNVRRDPTDVLVDDYPFRGRYDTVVRRANWLGPDLVEELLVRKAE